MKHKILPFEDLDDGCQCDLVEVHIWVFQGYEVLQVNCRYTTSFFIPVQKWLPFLANATAAERDTYEIGGTFTQGWHVKWPLLKEQLTLEQLQGFHNRFRMAPYEIDGKPYSGWK